MKNKDLFYISLFTILFSFNLINRNPVENLIKSSFSLEDQPLQISTKVLTSDESRSILNHDLPSKGYKPIEVTIHNTGSHTYTISRASTSLPCVKAEEIAWKATKGTLPRSIGLRILGFFFWPISIPSALESLHTLKKHRSTVSMLKAKGFKEDPETIVPYSLVKRVLYIPEDQFVDSFTFSLEDLTEDELVVIPVEVSAH